MSQESVSQLAAMLGRISILHEPKWREALTFDVAAAIGIAMRNLIPASRGAPGMIDIVMSAVLLHACRGNATALLILDQGRKCI